MIETFFVRTMINRRLVPINRRILEHYVIIDSCWITEYSHWVGDSIIVIILKEFIKTTIFLSLFVILLSFEYIWKKILFPPQPSLYRFVFEMFHPIIYISKLTKNNQYHHFLTFLPFSYYFYSTISFWYVRYHHFTHFLFVFFTTSYTFFNLRVEIICK